MQRRRAILVGTSALATSIIMVALIFTGIISVSSDLSCIGSGTSRTFTIIADLNGYNNSRTLVGLGVWPIMNVSRCDHVTIRLVNTDNQAHGLAVGVYANSGLRVPAGQTLSLGFLASKIGQFRVFCTIVCTVHDYMLNGQLNVT